MEEISLHPTLGRIASQANAISLQLSQYAKYARKMGMKHLNAGINCYQSDNLSQGLTALHIFDSHDDEWHPNTEANAHITDKTGTLIDLIPYHGSNNVMVGNDESFKITHIDMGNIDNKSCNIPLQNVLVRQIKKNLLRLTVNKGLPCYFVFDGSGFSIKDSRLTKC